MQKHKNFSWAKLFITYNIAITVITGSIFALWDITLAKSFLLGASCMLLPAIAYTIITFNHSQTAPAAKMLTRFFLAAVIKFTFVIALLLIVLNFFVINNIVFFIGICFSVILHIVCSIAKKSKNISYAQ